MDQPQLVTHVLRGVLGHNLLGVYLFGAAAQEPERPAPDLEFFAVLREGVPAARRTAMARILRHERAIDPQSLPVKITAVVQSEVRPWTYPPIADAIFDESLDDGHSTAPEPRPMIAIEATQVLAGYAAPLFGPPPGNLLDPVPRDDVVRAVRDRAPS